MLTKLKAALSKWDWKHTALSICGLGSLVCIALAQQAKDGEQLPFHLTAGGLGILAMVFGYVSKQLTANASGRLDAQARANAVRGIGGVALFAFVAAFASSLAGCLSSAPIVPVTSANQGQVTACENTASLHNGVVIGGFVLGGSSAALAGTAAALSDQTAKTNVGVAGAVVAGAAVVDAAIAELTASNFVNSQCSNVVGALPTASAPAATEGR